MKFVSLRRERYLYLVTFADRRSISESYSHADGIDLSEKEITKFLKANSAGATWTADNTGVARRFKRTDGEAEAMYTPLNGRSGVNGAPASRSERFAKRERTVGARKAFSQGQGMKRPIGIMYNTASSVS